MSSPEISSELEALIIRRLAETADRNKVVEEICLESGLHWSEADAIVERLVSVHKDEITRQQSPFLVLLSLSTFIGGVLLVAWNLLGVYNYIWPYLDPKTPDALGLYLFYSDAFQSLLNAPYAPPLFVTGLAMIAGSYFGMKDVWASIFDWFDDQRMPKPSRSPRRPLPASFADFRPAQDVPYFEENVSPETDSAPSQEVLDYIFEHMEKGQNVAQLVEEIWLKFGVVQPQGEQLVRQILSAAGKERSPKSTLASVMLAALALLSGFVWVVQFIILLSGYLSEISRPLENSWHLVLWLSDVARYVERFPGLFGLFVLGLILVAVGTYGLKDLWLLIFLLKRKSL